MAATFTRSAKLRWNGGVLYGSGTIAAGSGAFSVGARLPRLRGVPPGTTKKPEKLLAASDAAC